MKYGNVSTLFPAGKKPVELFFVWVNDPGDFGVNEMVSLDIYEKGK